MTLQDAIDVLNRRFDPTNLPKEVELERAWQVLSEDLLTMMASAKLKSFGETLGLEAEDVAQEVCLVLFKGAKPLQITTTAKSYLMTCLRNKLIAAYKKTKKHKVGDEMKSVKLVALDAPGDQREDGLASTHTALRADPIPFQMPNDISDLNHIVREHAEGLLDRALAEIEEADAKRSGRKRDPQLRWRVVERLLRITYLGEELLELAAPEAERLGKDVKKVRNSFDKDHERVRDDLQDWYHDNEQAGWLEWEAHDLSVLRELFDHLNVLREKKQREVKEGSSEQTSDEP